MRRIVAILVGALVLLCPAHAGARPSATASDAAPDIVLIVSDDQRFDTLWAMPILTERLAARGVTFPDAFVTNPLCCPSRASILTGNYSHTHLVYRQEPPFGRFEWFDDRSTLATWLHDAGYRTGMFGKYLDGYQHAAVTGYVPPGWDRWVAFVHSAQVDYSLTFDGQVRSFGHGPTDHATEVLANQVVSFIRGSSGRPLFVEFTPSVPHAPAIPSPGDENAFADLEPARPPSFDEADVSDKPAWVRALPRLSSAQISAIDAFRQDQYRSLLGLDRALGRILDALQETGRLDNTLIVFTSDNGILHGEHRWTKKEAPYEEAIRVPLVMRWDAAGWGADTEMPGTLALNIDLAPTIADAAGIPHPATDGRSLLPVLAGNARWRSDFLVEHLEGTNPIPTYCAVRSERWMYVRYTTGEEELYDLRDDPYELENLAANPADRQVLEGRRARLRELCSPVPPGYGDRTDTSVPIALGVVGALVIVEAVLARRRAQNPGVAR